MSIHGFYAQKMENVRSGGCSIVAGSINIVKSAASSRIIMVISSNNARI